MTKYEAMFCRRSVRKYTRPLEQERLDAVREFARSVQQMPGQNARFRIITREEMGAGPAPHYLVASCGSGNEAYANVGYVLEQVDLHLQSLGYGSLWWGMNLPAQSQEDDCIVLGMGYTDLPMRKAENAKRLELDKITNTDNAITRAVRMAPSAVNSQPWNIICGDREVVLSYVGRGLLKSRLEKKLNKVDLGIAARFAATELEFQGSPVQDITMETAGKEFSITLHY